MLKFFTYELELESDDILKYFDEDFPPGLRVNTEYGGEVEEKTLYLHGTVGGDPEYLIYSSLNPSSINMAKYFDRNEYRFYNLNPEIEIEGPGVLNGITLIVEKSDHEDYFTFRTCSNFPGKIEIIEKLKSVEKCCGETPRIGFDLDQFFDTSLRFSKVKDEGTDICYNSNYFLNHKQFVYLFDLDESEMTEEDKEILDYINNKWRAYKEYGEHGASSPQEGIYYFVLNDYWTIQNNSWYYGLTFTPENLLNIEFTSMVPQSATPMELHKPVFESSQYSEYNFNVYKPISYSYINTYEYQLPNGANTSIDLFSNTIKFTCLNEEGKPFYILLVDYYPYADM